MYFVFEIEFKSNKSYISDIIKAIAKKISVDLDINHTKDKIILVSKKDEPELEEFLKDLESNLPASINLGKSKHYLADEKPEFETIVENSLPLDLALCPSCQKEMFDVSSRRYYYPFTSCNCCGSRHSFLEQYPYKRKNSTMKFLSPCQACQNEMKENPLRRDYPLISCIDCGISLKMLDKKDERYANDKGSYRKLFEVAAKAISKGKIVIMQTTFGRRKFFKPTQQSELDKSILLITDASKLNEHLMMVPQEFNALLSIERPLLRIATKSTELKKLYESSLWCKYPDDGMSMLLAKELMTLSLDFVAYKECEDDSDGDFLIDFDIPIKTQNDFKLFINQDIKLLISGERLIYPQTITNPKRGRLSFANDFISVDGVIDKIEYFSKLPASEVYIENDEPIELEFENIYKFDGFKASMLSVLAEHDRLTKKAIGVHFDDKLHFLYYNQKEVIDIVSPKEFNAKSLFENITNLRNGSDRLVKNFKKKFPDLYERLDKLDNKYNIFDVTAILLELENESFDGISATALTFMGKGGVQIDIKVEDNYFNNYAYIASLMSYKLTDADAGLLCYSIYESFGDYIADIVNQLMNKTKSTTLTLSGETFANQALWGRIQRNLALKKPILNVNYPIGHGNEIYGTNYL